MTDQACTACGKPAQGKVCDRCWHRPAAKDDWASPKGWLLAYGFAKPVRRLAVVVGVGLALGLLAQAPAPVVAMPVGPGPGAVANPHREGFSLPAGSTPAATEVLFVWALDQPAVSMPEAMAVDAYAVIFCESTFRPDAANASGHTGLMQIAPVHRARVERMGYQWSDLLRGDVNLAVGTAIWREQSWRPWSCQP